MNSCHFTENYIVNPQHPVSINIIGCGGNGSQMLNYLARLHVTLMKLGHAGLFVRVFDADIVSPANAGRQIFADTDIGYNKAVTLVSRVNRYFGLDWVAIPAMYREPLFEHKDYYRFSNILITCVDNAKARIEISEMYKLFDYKKRLDNFYTPYYWLDLGNSKDSGQVILGTFTNITQPESKLFKTAETLPTILDLYPNLLEMDAEEIQGPSCSLAEALRKQDLFVNSSMAVAGGNLLWKLFSDLKIHYHGMFINMNTMSSSGLKIQ